MEKLLLIMSRAKAVCNHVGVDNYLAVASDRDIKKTEDFLLFRLQPKPLSPTETCALHLLLSSQSLQNMAQILCKSYDTLRRDILCKGLYQYAKIITKQEDVNCYNFNFWLQKAGYKRCEIRFEVPNIEKLGDAEIIKIIEQFKLKFDRIIISFGKEGMDNE